MDAPRFAPQFLFLSLAASSFSIWGPSAQSIAQPADAPELQTNILGDWVDGSQVQNGGPRMALHFKRNGAALTGTIDIPALGGIATPLANLSVTNGKLRFDLPGVAGHYEGTWNPAQHGFVGTFTFKGGGGPLTFVRGKLPQPKPITWSKGMAAGFDYSPVAARRATVGLTLPVGKCINLSNTLEAPTEGAWGPPVRDDDFKIINDAGFKTVRIPVRWSAHADETPPYKIDPTFLRRVHHVVQLATASGLNVILNVHHYDGLNDAPEAHTDRFVRLWSQIAESFSSAPASVWFELLNEPHGKLNSTNLPQIYAGALKGIRQTNPHRPVVIGGDSSIDSLIDLRMPEDDPYVVPTFHYYTPFEFSHQGATWSGPYAPPIGRSYGSAEDKALLDKDLKRVAEYMDRTGRVPFNGEFGAQDDPRVPVQQRIRYYRAVSSAFASIGIESCAWGYKNGFKLRGKHGWIPGMTAAVVTTKS